LTGRNDWARTANLYVVTSATNATFPSQQNYDLINNSTIKVPFEVPWYGTQTKNVSYRINEGVKGYSFSFRYEQTGLGVVIDWLIPTLVFSGTKRTTAIYMNTFSMMGS